MKKLTHRLTSVLLALVLVVGLAPLGTVTAGAYPAAYSTPACTGNQLEDLIRMAASQDGYTEENANNDVAYNHWYGPIDGSYSYSWCASFVSWCANKANIPTTIIPKSASVRTHHNYGTWTLRAYANPQRGDLIVFDWTGSSEFEPYDHIGIVESVDNTNVYVWEGNTRNNKVERRTWLKTDSQIHGYIRPKYEGTSTPTIYEKPFVQLDQKEYLAGDSMSFTWKNVGAAYYEVKVKRLDKLPDDTGNASEDGTMIYDTSAPGKYDLSHQRVYSRDFNEPLQTGYWYKVYVRSKNSSGAELANDWDYFCVTPNMPTISVSGNLTVGQTLTATWPSTSGASYTVAAKILYGSPGSSDPQNEDGETVYYQSSQTTASASFSIPASIGSISSTVGKYIKIYVRAMKGNTLIEAPYYYSASAISAAATTTYTVTYNANGGSVSPTSAPVNAGSSVTLPTPTRSGYAFNGWYTASSGGTKVGNAGASYTPSRNVTLYAQWTVNSTYTTLIVGNNSININGAYDYRTFTPSESGEYIIESLATSNSIDPDFHIWDDSINNWVYYDDGPESTTYYNFKLIKSFVAGRSYSFAFGVYGGGNGSYIVKVTKVTPSYMVTYNANGGSVSPASETVNAGSSIVLSAPTRNGYTFNGWYTASSGGTKVGNAGASYTPSGNVTLYAQWTATSTSYTITFNGQNGSPVPSPITTSSGYATIPATPPSRSGYTFMGWYKDSSGSGLAYYPGDIITVTSSFTLYAVWQSAATTHTATYNYSANGGSSASTTTATIAEGAAISLTPTATKTGWEFVGWNTNSSATTALSSLTMSTSNVTLYAIFKKTLTGTFVDYSGTTQVSGTIPVTIYNNSTSGTITTRMQNTYTGWTSRGWTTETAGNASVTVAANTGYSISSDTTFYGLYQRSVTISYNTNGGTPTPPSVSGTQYLNSYGNYTGVPFTVAAAPTKQGSVFMCWTKSVQNPPSISGGGSSLGDPYMPGTEAATSGDTIMYAEWKKTDSSMVTVTFIDYSGSTKTTRVVPLEIPVGEQYAQVPVPAQNECTGWSARGWAESTSENALALPLDRGYMTSIDLTFYGVYSRQSTVSYNANGGSNSPASQTFDERFNSYDMNARTIPTLTLPSAGTKNGYSFLGWYTALSGGKKVGNAGESYTVPGTVTLYAQWNDIVPTQYTLTLNPNDGTVSPSTVTQATGSTYALPTPTRSGHTFNGWTLSGGGSLNGNTYTFGTSNGTVTAQWTANSTNYIVTVNSGTGGGSYAAGATVTITANAAPSGKTFDKWTTSDGVNFTNASATTTTFTMLAKNVLVTATYKDAPSAVGKIFSTKYDATPLNWILFFLCFGFIWMWF